MAYGGPASLDDVEPYLLDVRGGRPTSPELVAEIKERYRRIGGRSPLLEITRAQAHALETRLNSDGRNFRVYVGMRHWHPYIREAVTQIIADKIAHVVALCMAPHYSRMSVGAYFEKLRAAQSELGAALDITFIESWHDHPLLIRAIVEQVQAALKRFPPSSSTPLPVGEGRDDVQIVFTAHSLPERILREGDPYDTQLRETARALAARLGLAQWRFCYQSAGRSGEPWLGPPVEKVVVELADAGQKNILVVPIGFVADHVEVLYDIDIEVKRLAEARGARLERTESLNTSPTLIEALADIVKSKLKAA